MVLYCVVIFLFSILSIENGDCLWRKGIVHYAINKKDYDFHSQDIIKSTLEKIQREICIRFFNTPLNYSANEEDKVLYISNADKRKDCPLEAYDFDETVVDLKIGYKCLNEYDIARLIVDMLRASIAIQGRPNNYGHDQGKKLPSALLSAKDRNFINSHYHEECADLILDKPPVFRRGGDYQPCSEISRCSYISQNKKEFYKNKLWPLGVVMYGATEEIRNTSDMEELRFAMTTIEIASCIVFRSIEDGPVPKNYLWFSLDEEVDSMPRLGFTEGVQRLLLPPMVHGAPGHSAHILNLLLRILGIPMMSNRYDRDHYITVQWKNVKRDMRHYLERMPEEAMFLNSEGELFLYDFESATHAPSNYLCADCSLGQQTVSPVQDHLWYRTRSMGHRKNLSPTDVEILKLLYKEECQSRVLEPNGTII